MTRLPPSSSASASCPSAPDAGVTRLLWRPSPLCVGTLCALALLAPLAVLASALPLLMALPLALAALGWGMRDAWRYRRSPGCVLTVAWGSERARCDDDAIEALRVRWRGPLAFVDWRDSGRCIERRVFWPDVLDAAARRELRLAMARRRAAQPHGSMAG